MDQARSLDLCGEQSELRLGGSQGRLRSQNDLRPTWEPHPSNTDAEIEELDEAQLALPLKNKGSSASQFDGFVTDVSLVPEMIVGEGAAWCDQRGQPASRTSAQRQDSPRRPASPRSVWHRHR